ncbi:MAG TPA: MBL fold metallo-hydrolase [Bacillota bacterium]|nr:MBL fold metallo-hydrolase [Bacillota bacterium]
MILNLGYDSTNYYLIPLKNQQYLLVDCGWPGTLPKLRSQLKRYTIELNQIKYLILTHFHPDHAGIAEDLRRSGSVVILEEKQLPWARQAKQQYLKNGKPKAGTSPYLELDTSKLTITSSVKSQALFSQFGLQAEFINTPGHSDDSVTLAVYPEGCFTGDLHLPSQVAPEWFDVVNESWAKIKRTGLTKIYPGHGWSFELE